MARELNVRVLVADDGRQSYTASATGRGSREVYSFVATSGRKVVHKDRAPAATTDELGTMLRRRVLEKTNLDTPLALKVHHSFCDSLQTRSAAERWGLSEEYQQI